MERLTVPTGEATDSRSLVGLGQAGGATYLSEWWYMSIGIQLCCMPAALPELGAREDKRSATQLLPGKEALKLLVDS
ncbi:hypothetical protein NDU88_002445 [Pleurodeles waltl]|uniref:Uncharacterized protein n=1 Tax=Pleurodeles waltl TaxID=8319 RepID=A0AAV7WL95_PLEWA|nr:hypothetical protein NDU88_002445 [Pleurodeles waltl]